MRLTSLLQYTNTGKIYMLGQSVTHTYLLFISEMVYVNMKVCVAQTNHKFVINKPFCIVIS